MQIKITLKYYRAHIRMSKLKQLILTVVAEEEALASGSPPAAPGTVEQPGTQAVASPWAQWACADPAALGNVCAMTKALKRRFSEHTPSLSKGLL